MNSYDLEKVGKKLIKMLQDRFEINFDNIKENYLELNLHGDNTGLEASDFLYLFFDVEKEFNIRIPEEDILTGKFKTIKGIGEIIIEQKNLSRESV